jgi:hypothetical protein
MPKELYILESDLKWFVTQKCNRTGCIELNSMWFSTEPFFWSPHVAVSLLVEETAIPGENHRPVASHRQTSSLNVVVSTPRLAWFELTLVAIGTDCTDRYKSNYDVIKIQRHIWKKDKFRGMPRV